MLRQTDGWAATLNAASPARCGRKHNNITQRAGDVSYYNLNYLNSNQRRSTVVNKKVQQS